MTMMISSNKLKALLKMWTMQAVIVLVVSAASLLSSYEAAISVVFGGLVYMIPNGYLGIQTFRATGARKAAQTMGNIYRGELGKFALTVVGFAVVFVSGYPVHLPFLFVIYIVLVILQAYQISRAHEFSQY